MLIEFVTAARGVGEVAHVLGVRRAEQALRELQHQRLVAGRHPEDAHDHPQGERHREIRRQVALATEVDEALGVLLRDLVDRGLEATDPQRA
jgi:hypothetical protein